MKKHLLVFALMVVVILLLSACGQKEAVPSTAEPLAQNIVPASQPVVAAADPAENLGLKMGSSYLETLKQVVAILKDKPAEADVKAMLADLKNWTIELMVGLGKEREAMSEHERAVVDRILGNKIASVPGDLFKEYQEGQAFYKENSELFTLIADFNIITQYANFDLLKKQLPEEAKRLGIE